MTSKRSRSPQAALSRPTSSAFRGKQTTPLKTLVFEQVHEDFQRFAREAGYDSVSDCLRELVMVAMYGKNKLTDVHRQRIESLFRNGAEIGTGA